MKTPQVVVANAGKHIVYHTALGVQRLGFLKQFVTTFYYKPCTLSGQLLSRFVPEAVLFNRYEPELRSELITSNWLPEVLNRGLRALQVPKKLINRDWVYSVSFDYWAARYVKGCDAFIGRGGCCLASMREAQRQGAVKILNQLTMHPVVWNSILKEEYQRYGKENLNFLDALEQRMVEEIALADWILVPSEGVYNSFLSASVSREKLVLIPFGVSTDSFRPLPKQDDCFRILYVGSLALHKGVQYLLEAYQQLDIPNSELVLIGYPEPEFLPILKAYSRPYTHIPYIPHRRLAEYYSNASVFVLPSLGESWGAVCLEAMACGKPVIVTANSRSVVSDGEDGFVIPIRDVGALTETIRLVYEDSDLRSKMGQCARKRVEAFTWESYYHRLGMFLTQILGL